MAANFGLGADHGQAKTRWPEESGNSAALVIWPAALLLAAEATLWL